MGRTPAPLIVDTGAIYASVDADDLHHEAVLDLLVHWEGELVVSPFVAAEADYMVLRRLGLDSQLLLLEDLAGAFLIDGLDAAGITAAASLCSRYGDLEIGLADASMVVLAEKWQTRLLATFDERHFRAIEPLQGGAFELLPADV